MFSHQLRFRVQMAPIHIVVYIDPSITYFGSSHIGYAVFTLLLALVVFSTHSNAFTNVLITFSCDYCPFIPLWMPFRDVTKMELMGLEIAATLQDFS